MRGLTLIEMMIVLGLTALVGYISLGWGLQDLQNGLAQADGTRMAAIARHARAQALHGTL